MAKKSMLFSVTLANGHKTWVENLVPARSKVHAESYFENEHIKAINTVFLGYYDVKVSMSPYDGVFFSVKSGEDWVDVSEGCIGYEYLKEVFLDQYNLAVIKFNTEFGG